MRTPNGQTQRTWFGEGYRVGMEDIKTILDETLTGTGSFAEQSTDAIQRIRQWVKDNS